ncbi:hypothetical protein JCM11251_007019 [Rhodosporidiobolus azoricus]
MSPAVKAGRKAAGGAANSTTRRTPRKRSASPASSSSINECSPPPEATVPASKDIRMSYRVGRGEEGVLTFEPYKSHLLPLWRFKTPDIARESSEKLWKEFLRGDEAGDFVWMDMVRKFEQMGMTRATRYARRAGGRKYDKETGDLLPQTTDHPGAQEKLESAAIFRAVWERCKEHEGYKRRRQEWEREKKGWERVQKEKKAGKGEVKEEEGRKQEEGAEKGRSKEEGAEKGRNKEEGAEEVQPPLRKRRKANVKKEEEEDEE